MKQLKQLSPYLELGRINTLRVDRLTTPGIYLMAADGHDVLLPHTYVKDTMTQDTLLDVFLYTDSEDRLVATTLTPKAMLDEFGLFEVVDIAPFGAFVDWGLPKDLLVPKMFQKKPFQVGEKRFLKVVYDERTHRLVGTEKLGDFFETHVKGLKTNQEVKILILSQTPLGFKCLVEDKYQGLIYHNEIFESITLGQEKNAYVKKIRPEGTIDLSLRKIGSKGDDASANSLMQLLKKSGGILPYNYKSDAQLIKEKFSMSKKEFKRILTKLQNENKIKVKDTGIYIVSAK